MCWYRHVFDTVCKNMYVCGHVFGTVCVYHRGCFMYVYIRLSTDLLGLVVQTR